MNPIIGRPGAPSRTLSRRGLLVGSATATAGLLVGCAEESGAPGTRNAAVGPHSDAVRKYAAAQRRRGGRSHRLTLDAAVDTVDLGGPVVDTWTFGGRLPGRIIRGTAGDEVTMAVRKRLPEPTSVHWHGLAVPNDVDGVPGVTQDPIAAGASFEYRFTLPDPGTYWYHSHSGLQLDRGLFGPLIIDDPHEAGRYDHDWIVVLDDWVDGIGRTPEQVLVGLQSMDMGGPGSSASSQHGTGHMGSMGQMTSGPLGGDAGDVRYPYYLVNGRVAAAPETFRARAGQRARIRFINAGADTAFRVGLGGHRLRVTHADGFPVQPVTVDSLLLGMGERYDVEVTLGDGAFPLAAMAEGKGSRAMAVVRTAAGRAPRPGVSVPELTGRLLTYGDLRPRGEELTVRTPDRVHDLVLGGQMMPYRWTINGETFGDHTPLPVRQGEYLRLRFINTTTMFHPMHLHGHTFAVRGGAGPGIRKDTVIVRPGERIEVDLRADNPGQWVVHCHNDYHMQTGMMTVLSYRA